MASLTAGACAYASSLITVYTLYPYRDYVKMFDVRSMPKIDIPRHCASRYLGMLRNPSQPLLLAAPQGLLYGGYVLGSGGLSGALFGGLFSGYAKVFVASIAHRMAGVGSRYNRLDHITYRSTLDCIIASGKQYGMLSFFTGGIAAALIATCWHGTALIILQQNYDRGFFGNWWSAFYIHGLLTLCTTPLRNTFRSALYQGERSGGVQTIRSYFNGELAIFSEAGNVLRLMMRTEGLRFFMNGVLRTTFKTSLPFGVTYATFKALGGSLGPSAGRSSGPHRAHRPFRRFH